MTPIELHKKICRMWPNAAATGKDYAELYLRILKNCKPKDIDAAWEKWHRKPPHQYPPKPYEIQKMIFDAQPPKPQPTEVSEPRKYLTDADKKKIQASIGRLEENIKGPRRDFKGPLASALRSLGHTILKVDTEPSERP